MGVRGPLPQSRAEAELKGSRGRARRQPTRTARVERVPMPRDLDGEAAELWRAVVPKLCKAGQLTALDIPALRDMCETWAAVRDCERQLKRDGRAIVSSRGEGLVKHPLTAVVKGYRESLLRYWQKFGLTVADRARLPEPEEDPGPSLADVLAGKVWAVAEEDPLAELRDEGAE